MDNFVYKVNYYHEALDLIKSELSLAVDLLKVTELSAQLLYVHIMYISLTLERVFFQR